MDLRRFSDWLKRMRDGLVCHAMSIAKIVGGETGLKYVYVSPEFFSVTKIGSGTQIITSLNLSKVNPQAAGSRYSALHPSKLSLSLLHWCGPNQWSQRGISVSSARWFRSFMPAFFFSFFGPFPFSIEVTISCLLTGRRLSTFSVASFG